MNFSYNLRQRNLIKDRSTPRIFGMKTSYPMLNPQSSESGSPRGRCALGVIIKAPRAGASKTRLVPPLTHEEAARLSGAFLRDTAENMADACAEYSDGAVHAIAVYTPVGAEGEFEGLLPSGFALLAQRGDTFGESLFHAAADLLRLGYESCCLIDSDSPTLPPARLTTMIEQLLRPGDRVVLGPADDGGYYLIGMKRAHARLFEDIAWSTADVLTHTVERAREIDLEVRLLPTWYDVDDAYTLRRLYDELFDATFDAPFDAAPGTKLAPYPAPHTRAELARLIDAGGRARILNGSARTRARGEGGG
jgi:hypothetical protein